MAKLKLASYWAASCGGCDVAITDISEKLLDLAEIADIVFWPIAMDFKYKDVESIPDGYIDVCLFNGSIRSSEQEEMAKLLRVKAKTLIAFGSCACFGGIPALANFSSNDQLLGDSYVDAPSNDNTDKVLPQVTTKVEEGDLTLPSICSTVRTLSQVIPVEYYVPGCPPPVALILELINDLAENKLPEVGSTLASTKTVCDECPLHKENKCIVKIYRPQEIIPDKEKCLLEQGLICCGPATRGGCGAACIKAGMPCRGCFGPPDGILDQGAKLVSAIASIYQAGDEEEITRMVNEIIDPAGTFYRFSLASSILRGKHNQE